MTRYRFLALPILAIAAVAAGSHFITHAQTGGTCANTVDIGFAYVGGVSTTLFTETGENSGNGGGLNQNLFNNQMQEQCRSMCSVTATTGCNYIFRLDTGSSDQSGTRFSCVAITGGTLQQKSIVYGGPQNRFQTLYSAIVAPASCIDTTNPPAGVKPTAAIGVIPGTIIPGASSTLSWVCTNATTATGINFSTRGALSGSVEVAPTETMNYGISCNAGTTTGSPIWKYSRSDVSDLTCPVTNAGIVYSGVPTCPADPEGKTCSASGSICKVNTIDNNGACLVHTDVYACTGTTGGNATAFTKLTVSDVAIPTDPPGGPDLTADAASSSLNPAIDNAPVTLSAVIRNTGDGATPAGVGIPVLFQMADSENGVHASDVGTVASVGTLLPDNSVVATLSHTFTTVGTYFIRACADKRSAGDTNGLIPEGNEDNNCGAWSQLVISTSAPVASLTATPQTIQVGEQTQLAWSCQRATSAVGNGFSTGNATTGSVTVAPTVTTTYQVTCTGAGGSSAFQAVVTVIQPNLTILAKPDRVDPGHSADISWSARQVRSCTVTASGAGGDTYSWAGTATAGDIASTTITRKIPARTVYTLNCVPATGGAAISNSTVVNIVPTIKEI